MAGAVEFIAKVEQAGITVVFITNRRESLRQPTVATLERLGVNTEGLARAGSARLLMRDETSSKNDRRKATEERYDVIALFGDNLADCSGEFEPKVAGTPEARLDAAMEDSEMWGTRCFVLPNPTYGDWRGVLTKEPLAENLVGTRVLPQTGS
ncbi:MAG: hypothetical protein GY953_26170 [bacterium]|nr:hypothetical protein [bacterium]